MNDPALRVSEYLLAPPAASLAKPGQPCPADIKICLRRQRDGTEKWAAYQAGEVFTKEGGWLVEPMPSNRDEAFITLTRFDSVDEVLAALRKYKCIPLIPLIPFISLIPLTEAPSPAPAATSTPEFDMSKLAVGDLDPAGIAKMNLTVLESSSLVILNTLKAWIDSGGEGTRPPFPAHLAMEVDAVLAMATLRRRGVQ